MCIKKLKAHVLLRTRKKNREMKKNFQTLSPNCMSELRFIASFGQMSVYFIIISYYLNYALIFQTEKA